MGFLLFIDKYTDLCIIKVDKTIGKGVVYEDCKKSVLPICSLPLYGIYGFCRRKGNTSGV